MIDEQKTKEDFGYEIKYLKPNSSKKIVVICDYCHNYCYPTYKNYQNSKINTVIDKDACLGCRNLKKKECNSARDRAEIIKQSTAKRKKTNLVKYGTEFAAQSEIVKNKQKETISKKTEEEWDEIVQKREETLIKNTGLSRADYTRKVNMEKYGVPYIPCTDEIKEKRNATFVEKYGGSPVNNPEIRKKIRETTKEKYGVDYWFQTEESKQITKEQKPANSTEANHKRIQTNLEKYGAENPQQNEEIKKKTRETNIQRGHIKIYEGLTIKEWSDKKEMSESQIKYIVKNYGQDSLARFEKYEGSNIEMAIAEMLDEIGVKYDSKGKAIQRRKTDFIIGDLVIEADSLYYHCDQFQLNDKYHAIKKKHYTDNGFKSVFFRSDEIIAKKEIVKSILANKLNLIPNKIYARKCKIVKLSRNEAKIFLLSNHLMGNGFGQSYALTYKDQTVTVMQICHDKTNSGLEISRFCHKICYNVVGGFSKLLNFICNDNQNAKFISTFIDLRYGEGDYLSNLGFNKISEHLSFKWTNGKFTFHRLNFPGQSGYENGLAKIWDCGQAKWVKSLK